MLTIGEIVPSAVLDVYHKDAFTKIKLEDYRGTWLVLLFYPADFTFVCPTELEDAAKHYAAFQKEGAEIVSVSTDTTLNADAKKASRASMSPTAQFQKVTSMANTAMVSRYQRS